MIFIQKTMKRIVIYNNDDNDTNINSSISSSSSSSSSSSNNNIITITTTTIIYTKKITIAKPYLKFMVLKIQGWFYKNINQVQLVEAKLINVTLEIN